MSNKNKGVRERNRQLVELAKADKEKGLTFGQIARKYGKDRSNLAKMINGTLNERKAGMAKLVDARDLKSLGCNDCGGSIPSARTKI